MRPYDLVVVPLVAAAGAALAAPVPAPLAESTAAVIAAAACSSALYAADYLTRAEDLATKPRRPIPSGRLSPRAAKTSAILAALITVVLACLMNPRTLLFVALSAAAYYAYGKWLKNRGLWGDAASGFAGWSCSLLVGACLTTPWPPAGLIVVAAALGLQGAFGNLLLAVNDRSHDQRAGCRTFPVRHGQARAARALAGLAAATYATAALAPLVTGRRPTPGFFLFLGVALLMAVAALAVAWPHRLGGARPRQAITWHLFERLLLPGALLALTGRSEAAAIAVALAASVVALTPRPILPPDTRRRLPVSRARSGDPAAPAGRAPPVGPSLDGA
ncbi:UbiA family prenyltransferase [Streptomyces millisiae]|uniref:UbiA family prenyltransferase n=1 Tax=Streptomyces millisiae TaxID=3075542 RepID=A0ABU2LHM4_9ACTN|nr:UbiA family prenyltransferase [Streptomyces sp. DSM 44918]MDT0317091.1 UbiA family prenyltransferase [Streptomyces sp. DSM 44918]